MNTEPEVHPEPAEDFQQEPELVGASNTMAGVETENDRHAEVKISIESGGDFLDGAHANDYGPDERPIGFKEDG